VIPRNLFRTVPAVTGNNVETWWTWAVDMHQGWNCVTYRDPLDPDEFPLTSPYWDLCRHGAQVAGLIRLELVYTYGGVYIDSDVQVFRSFAPLLGLQAFAGWEDVRVVPDAIFGAVAGHPAIQQCLDAAISLVKLGKDPWETGPGVFTDILPGRQDVTLFPPATFDPYHYNEKRTAKARADHGASPWCYAAHHWHGSWVPKKA
jgi:mannosyltransferase OCH1-like enzyme